jgi:hypothetical protein
MSPDAPPFARYVALVLALKSEPEPAPLAASVPRGPKRVYTVEDKQRYTDLRASGVSINRSAKVMGVPLGTIKFWEEQRKGNR